MDIYTHISEMNPLIAVGDWYGLEIKDSALAAE
jgi:hypothetical protein